MLGGTAGRTTLNGEGLQHQDGHSLLVATTVPNVRAYDAGFAYEVAVIVQDGLRRMYEEEEDTFYYLALYNESHTMPAMPAGMEEGILRGIYRLAASEGTGPRARILASGPMVPIALEARGSAHGGKTTAWRLRCSATSYQLLRRDAQAGRRMEPGQPRRAARDAGISRPRRRRQRVQWSRCRTGSARSRTRLRLGSRAD